jgi:predicted AAA+ superfamily ATPase
MIARLLLPKIQKLLKMYPVASVTGPRQSGKSTLIKSAFPDYTYVSLEDPDKREWAASDPRGFLDTYSGRAVIDEAQYATELFSYLQTKVDQSEANGQYILSGSQNFLLSHKISQSLAGRVGVTTLLPLACKELVDAGITQNTVESIYMGGYPRIFNTKSMTAADFYQDYLLTYIERDIQTLVNVQNLAKFRLFLGLLAARVGQVLNVTSLANDANITVETVNSWLSILETCFVIFMLRPYDANLGKRLIKSPKIYFYDTGLLASLLKITTLEKLTGHANYGNLFENFVVSERLKFYLNQRLTPDLYFWRDSNAKEVDLVDITQQSTLVEIKSGQTAKTEFGANLDEVGALLDIPRKNQVVVYAGESVMIKEVQYWGWRDWLTQAGGQCGRS